MFDKLSQENVHEVHGIWEVLAVAIELAANLDKFLELVVLHEKLEECLVIAELAENTTCVQGHVNVILVFVGKLVNKVIDNVFGLGFEHFLDLCLLWAEFWLGSSLVVVIITLLTSIPLLLLTFWLNLNLNEMDEEHGQRVVLHVFQKGIENFTILFNEKISEQLIFLLKKQLLHNFEEVSAQNWEWIFIRVEETCQFIKHLIVWSFNLFLLFLFSVLSGGTSVQFSF